MSSLCATWVLGFFGQKLDQQSLQWSFSALKDSDLLGCYLFPFEQAKKSQNFTTAKHHLYRWITEKKGKKPSPHSSLIFARGECELNSWARWSSGAMSFSHPGRWLLRSRRCLAEAFGCGCLLVARWSESVLSKKKSCWVKVACQRYSKI